MESSSAAHRGGHHRARPAAGRPAAGRRPRAAVRRPRRRQDDADAGDRRGPAGSRGGHLADVRHRPGPPSLRGGPPLVHVDAYRLGSLAEVDDLDLDASLEESVTVVEWGEGKVEGLSDDRLEVDLRRSSDELPTTGGPRCCARVGPRWSGVRCLTGDARFSCGRAVHRCALSDPVTRTSTQRFQTAARPPGRTSDVAGDRSADFAAYPRGVPGLLARPSPTSRPASPVVAASRGATRCRCRHRRWRHLVMYCTVTRR